MTTRFTITAVDSRVRQAASVTTTDQEKVKQIVVAAYRLAGYRVTVTEDAPADPQLELPGEGS